jgi:hypothetical protein
MAVIDTRQSGVVAARVPPGTIVEISGPRWVTGPVDALLASVLLPEPLPHVTVAVSENGRRAEGYVNGFELWSIAIPRRRWLEVLTGQIVATITMLLRRLVFVHAGAVEVAGRGCILIGQSGAGKTSTVAALLLRGAAYLSDEVALLDPGTNGLVPFQLPMAIKRWTARAARALPSGTDVTARDTVIFRLPDRLGRACPLSTAVLLERGGRPQVRDLSRAEALVRLARQPSSFHYAGRTEDAFRAWAGALRTARCLLVSADRPAATASTLLRIIEPRA